jgi:hypothetical protein
MPNQSNKIKMEKVKKQQKNNELTSEKWDKYWEKIDNYLGKTLNIKHRLEKGEVIPATEVKKLLRDNFESYFKGEVDQKFIISLGARIYELCLSDIEGPELEQILDTVCPLDDITAGTSKQKSSREIDQLIHQLFEEYLKE